MPNCCIVVNEVPAGMNLQASFSKLRDDERDRLVEAGEIRIFRSGDIILKEGEKVEALLIIKSGNLRVTRAYLDQLSAEFAGPLGPGEVIGEMSLLDGMGASASLIADGDAEILSIPRAKFTGLVAADIGFAARFYESLLLDVSRKLRSTNLRVLPVAP